MNYVICTTIVALGLILTGYATAADEINRQDVVGLMPSDYISVGNLYTPEEVATALKDKAEQAGGSHFRITSFCLLYTS
ncbi:YdgH/BhsA/McbA family protein, partial [Escherichia coli]